MTSGNWISGKLVGSTQSWARDYNLHHAAEVCWFCSSSGSRHGLVRLPLDPSFLCFWLHDCTRPVIILLVIEEYSHVLLLFLTLVSSLAGPLFSSLVVLKLLACFFVLSGTVLFASIDCRRVSTPQRVYSTGLRLLVPPETTSRRSRTRSLCVSVHNPGHLRSYTLFNTF